ncbi:ATP synthase subunit epsilon-like protein, mitochondrial [Tubulanus polymorphus]|uniref:ATP synthase subunit epsilon-like protein, mitochondrial n=1 Tax=Tubulanus polymorphus TaxID=672921 RepID=UPI003DA426EB
MVAFWRQAGLTYVQFSSICARVVRQSLKQQFQEAKKEGVAHVKVTKWEAGKPIKNGNNA